MRDAHASQGFALSRWAGPETPVVHSARRSYGPFLAWLADVAARAVVAGLADNALEDVALRLDLGVSSSILKRLLRRCKRRGWLQRIDTSRHAIHGHNTMTRRSAAAQHGAIAEPRNGDELS